MGRAEGTNLGYLLDLGYLLNLGYHLNVGYLLNLNLCEFRLKAYIFSCIIKMSPVSEKIEIHINGSLRSNHRKTTFQEQLWRGIRINIRNLGKELLITLPILLLKFIPVVNIFSTILLFLLQAYYAGFGNMDYTLERYFNYKESVSFVSKNKGFSIGNGIVFMLCLLIPVLGIIIVLPLSVTAASVKTVELLNQEDVRQVL